MTLIFLLLTMLLSPIEGLVDPPPPHRIHLPFIARAHQVKIYREYTSVHTPLDFGIYGTLDDWISVSDETRRVESVILELEIEVTGHVDLSRGLLIHFAAPNLANNRAVQFAGLPGPGTGFHGTRLLNTAITPIQGCLSPCTGNFRPVEPFPAGMSARGIWYLALDSDDYPGTLKSWKLGLVLADN